MHGRHCGGGHRGWHNCGEHHHDPREATSRRGGWWMGMDPLGGFWGGGKGSGGWGPRRARPFEQGDLKYVILRLLEEKPRHGYEIIKELEDRFAGAYSPSPGTVYPTLAMLEDLGYARTTPEESGKKIFEITDEGRKHLSEHKTTVEDIFERIANFGSGFFSDSSIALNKAMGEVARAAYSTYGRQNADSERLSKITEVLKKAAAEIEELAKGNS